MDTVDKLSQYAKTIGNNIKIIGIPKTIDNDLCVTDHTPGYGSAAKYVASTLLEIGHDTSIYPIKSVTIVEIMGRDAGWLTGASVLARNKYNFAPHLIYLPEVPFVEEEFIEDVKAAMEKYNNVVIAVSEGIKDANGKYVSATTAVKIHLVTASLVVQASVWNILLSRIYRLRCVLLKLTFFKEAPLICHLLLI